MRVAVADDSVLLRDGLVLLLEAAGHEVMTATSSGTELLAQPQIVQAEVAILDIMMPPEPFGGLTTAKTLRERYPDMGILLLSQYAEASFVNEMLSIHTASIGYRIKDRIVSVKALTDTLNRIADGELVIEPVLAAALVERSAGKPRSGIEALTAREREVLRLMAEGRSNPGIAGELYLSVKAIEKHIASIFTKLDLSDEGGSQHRRVLAVLAYLDAQPRWTAN
ncbi:LuxR family two component transcriptional regulator [Jatrophihabitans sp. GAS493]|uniref:LuxR C-terminal-related transcriptional regulator n=1 Tax=Jatrophihabitans sp. GAS493 TaxID=1907575 RepID=UPI000BB84463|nr:response regulator transcription factor [Jatrophihabitans sp. GAS493]SOD75021.1 LuxR family two component transcriptional regulator [Jatrophihabitans sp. GAS493]